MSEVFAGCGVEGFAGAVEEGSFAEWTALHYCVQEVKGEGGELDLLGGGVVVASCGKGGLIGWVLWDEERGLRGTGVVSEAE